jgi:phosphohistidine swiveling domain-containing protein
VFSKEIGLTQEEIFIIREGYKGITDFALSHYKQFSVPINELKIRHDKLVSSKLPPLHRAMRLLSLCREYGTLPFSHLARCAFIATNFLLSAESEGVLTLERREAFQRSIWTIGHELIADANHVYNGSIFWIDFVQKYGHLRPGSYDINSETYSRKSELYLRPLAERPHLLLDEKFEWSISEERNISNLLSNSGYKQSPAELSDFIKFSISERENSKFEFTRTLSQALEDIADFGETLGISRVEMSLLDITDLFALINGSVPHGDPTTFLRGRIEEGLIERSAADAIELPPLLSEKEELWAFYYPNTEPNYITSGRVVGLSVTITENFNGDVELNNKIVVISQADPGYDWLFGHDISGLITIYGGANSHMAIRAAEFNIPSAIGVGKSRYDELSSAQAIDLNCKNRVIRVIQ